jgi:pentatricopeptide repeat protein
MAYNNIAVIYANQGEYEKALELFQKALVILVKILDKNHPNTETVISYMKKVFIASRGKEKDFSRFLKKQTGITI